MAVTLKVTGNGAFHGSATSLESYSVSESGTPISLADSSGGTGDIDFSVVVNDDTFKLLYDTVTLEDDSNGTTTGRVSDISTYEDLARVGAASRLNLLVNEVTAMPFTGSVRDAFIYYFSLAGITEDLIVDASFTETITTVGFRADLWERLKQLCAVGRAEIALVSNQIVVRPLRTRLLEARRNSSMGWNIRDAKLARSVEVYAYNSEYRSNEIVYPEHGWNEDVSVYQIESGQVSVVRMTLDASLSSVEQPVAVDHVEQDYVGPSAYCLVNRDGKPISAAHWIKGGGKIEIKIMPDTTTLEMTITAPKDRGAPVSYRIAAPMGEDDVYSSLRLRGTGVVFLKEIVSISTGAAEDRAAQDVGITIDSPFVDTVGDAFTHGMSVAQYYTAPSRYIDIESTVFNRRGDKGSMIYPTFADFEAMYPTETFAEWDAIWAGKTFAEFNAAMADLLDDDFANQAFGNIGGGRVRYGSAYYRAREARTTQDGASVTAEADTTFADFNAEWAGRTFAEFNAVNSEQTFADFTLEPLKT